MTNVNCLCGIACPKCGNDSRILVEVQTLAVVTDDGAETFGDMEWDGDSYAACPECRSQGVVADFRTDNTDSDLTTTGKE